MKRVLYLLVTVLMTISLGCSTEYDDTDIKQQIEELQERIKDVETLLNASANNLTIVSVSETEEGYIVNFSDGSTISVNHGEDGKEGQNGQNGKDGLDGQDGKDGQDGLDGKDGETLIESISIGERDVTFILTSGKTVIIPLEGYYDQSEAPINFLDNTTKVLCVLAWDSDGDQELSYKEAAAVTDIGAVFRESSIMAFRELQFFTALTSIPQDAFYACEKLRAIALPENLQTIGDEAFRNCKSLVEVVVPTGVVSLGEKCFQMCEALERVVIPSAVERIPSYCFYGCVKLSDIVIEEGVSVVGDYSFQGCNALKNVEIPSSVTTIEEYAFYRCGGLEGVALPNGITIINKGTFYNCESLVSVVVPSGVVVIDDYAFRNCSSLVAVEFGGKLERIGSYSFYNCISLREVTIPASVTTIGGWTFDYCESLVAVCCNPIEPPMLSYDAFDHNGANRVIRVPSESVDKYRGASGWSDYALSIESL